MVEDDGEGGEFDQPTGALVAVSVAYEGSARDIARARELARCFLERLRSVHGVPVSERAVGMVQLVVSELVTNACKYAPGPCRLDLRLVEGRVEVAVWDSEPAMPVSRAADAGRVGQHGLEIVMAVSHTFQVRREPVGKCSVAVVPVVDDLGEAPRPTGPDRHLRCDRRS